MSTPNLYDSPLEHIGFTLSKMRSRYEQGLGRRQVLKEQLSDKEARLTELSGQVDIWRKVQLLLAQTSEYAREQLKTRIEETVTAALQAVISDRDLRFEIQIETRAGQPTASWQIISDYEAGTLVTDPERGAGGGVVDVVSAALRLAVLELSRPRPGGPVIQDEPGKMVSREYSPNLAQFLKDYAAHTERQIILITHNADLAEIADRSIRVDKVGDESVVTAA